ncbi:MAG TPA: hypothetical protein DEH22_01935, partial [Chloroflexi bacterium]|nr:hypothetical protein [Chloroflexota bacterium]
NTLADRQHRAVAGASLGGSAAYRLAFQQADTFASAGMFGSGLVNGDEERVIDWLKGVSGANKTRAFFNSGAQDPLMVERAQAMAEILDRAGVSYELIVDAGDHSYAYWGTHLGEYFRWAAQDW